MYSISSKVNFELYPAEVERVVGGATRDSVNRASITLMSRAKALAPVDTSKLRNSITRTQPAQVSRLFWAANVYTELDYALYQEEGTRAHGPVRAKALRFKPKGSSRYVFAKWVRGVPAQRYMARALDSLHPADFGL